jgi:hypothetical protein
VTSSIVRQLTLHPLLSFTSRFSPFTWQTIFPRTAPRLFLFGDWTPVADNRRAYLFQFSGFVPPFSIVSVISGCSFCVLFEMLISLRGRIFFHAITGERRGTFWRLLPEVWVEGGCTVPFGSLRRTLKFYKYFLAFSVKKPAAVKTTRNTVLLWTNVLNGTEITRRCEIHSPNACTHLANLLFNHARRAKTIIQIAVCKCECWNNHGVTSLCKKGRSNRLRGSVNIPGWAW